MTSVEVHPDAQAEFRDGIRWYNERSEQTARKFALAVKFGITAIREHPERYARWGLNYRHYLVNGFPYFIAYRNTPRTVVIVAIRHTSQDQDTWQGR